jgi:hypothetical protein
MRNDEVAVSKELIENIIEILSFNSDRGFNCFENEKNIINKLNQCINDMKEKRIELIFSSMIDFDNNNLVICNIEFLMRLRDLLKERYIEYDLLINNECVYSNRRILAEIKNRRDEFMIGGDLTDIIRKHDEKNKNLKELINMINKNEKVILEIEHSSNHTIDTNELRVEIPTKIITFDNDSLVIGSKLCCYKLETGIHFEFMIHDIETIDKAFLSKGFELKFYSCPSISFLFN